MKAIGLIVEYNPFHNGHLHHINEAKKRSQADVIIAVMSGSFSMRGNIAPINKFEKTKIALNHGIDLVIELPFLYTNQSADNFAYNAVYLLNQLNVDEIYFGSETDDIENLKKTAFLLDSEIYNQALKKYLHLSYPIANDLALEDLGFTNPSSNDSLAIQYIRAINKLHSKIKPYSIKRIDSSYNDIVPTSENIASATAIRQLKDISPYVPDDVNDIYLQRGFISDDMLFPYLKYKLKITDFASIHGFDDSLANLFSKAKIENPEDLDSLVSKRYTRSRINRLLLNVLLDIKKYPINNPSYIRVLGMNTKGQAYLNTIKKNISIPLIVKVKEGINKDLNIELKASKIFSLLDDIYTLEFQKPIIIDKTK